MNRFCLFTIQSVKPLLHGTVQVWRTHILSVGQARVVADSHFAHAIAVVMQGNAVRIPATSTPGGYLTYPSKKIA